MENSPLTLSLLSKLDWSKMVCFAYEMSTL